MIYGKRRAIITSALPPCQICAKTTARYYVDRKFSMGQSRWTYYCPTCLPKTGFKRQSAQLVVLESELPEPLARLWKALHGGK
jgi:hypothetical protein